MMAHKDGAASKQELLGSIIERVLKNGNALEEVLNKSIADNALHFTSYDNKNSTFSVTIFFLSRNCKLLYLFACSIEKSDAQRVPCNQ